MQSLKLRGPQGENDAAALVAQPVASGPGVCTSSNLDSTGMRCVKRGSVVEYPGGFTARVVRVRLGSFWADGYASPSFTPCSRVRVIS